MHLRRKKKTGIFWAMQVFLLCCYLLPQAQTVKTFIDKQDILIGEQLKYKVVASFAPGAFNVRWPNIPDSMPHFELVDQSKIDTSAENGNTVLQQTITLTSFDSGRWNTPVFPVGFEPLHSGASVNALTDSFTVNVGYAPADSTNQLRDIKPIMDVTIKSYFWYYVAGVVLVAALLAFILWRYFKNRAKKPAPVFRGKLPAFDEAMQELEKLRSMNLQQPDDIKQFHSMLGHIFKWYISRRQQFNSMNKTTGDVLLHLTGSHLPQDTVAAAAASLRTGDAVKFAKYLPGEAESMDALKNIRTVIEFIHTAGKASTASSHPSSTINPQP